MEFSRFSAVAAVVLAFGLASPSAWGQGEGDYLDVENVAAKSAQELPLGLGRAGAEDELKPARRILEQVLGNAVPFWRDSSASLKLRGYDFQRDNDIEILADASAIGTELGFKSGKWRQRVSAVASWHTSYGFDAPPDLGDTGILAPDQSDLSVISRAYLRVDLPQSMDIQLFRQDFNLPYLNRSDSRMIPNTHEAYILERNKERLEFLFGYVTKMKEKDSEKFVPMAEVAGVSGDDSGTSLGGLRFNITDGVSIGAMALRTSNLFTTAFSETHYSKTITDQWGLQVAAQVTQQWSIGEELLGDFNTGAAGMRAALSYQGAVLKLGYTKNYGDFKIRSPFGGKPSYTIGMLYDFDRANEDAWRIGLSQNFEAYRLPGLSVIVNYTKGRNATSDTGVKLSDESEFAITADYRPPYNLFRGLWLRVRYGEGSRGNPEANRRNIRIILNYNLNALR